MELTTKEPIARSVFVGCFGGGGGRITDYNLSGIVEVYGTSLVEAAYK